MHNDDPGESRNDTRLDSTDRPPAGTDLDHTKPELEVLVDRAKNGNRSALEEIARAIKDQVYGLALRMLGTPADAEDATQEILIKVVTRLDSFRGDSRFTTWVYAVAANHLRTTKRSTWERRRRSYEQMQEKLLSLPAEARPATTEHKVLLREIRLLCLHGLLLTLERESRLTFVLGEIFELSGAEGAQVLGIEPDAFRKRLSRARKRLHEFVDEHCGLVRPTNRCRCSYWCGRALEKGVLDPEKPMLAKHPAACMDDEDLEAHLGALDEISRLRAVFRTLPDYRAPGELLSALSAALDVTRPSVN